MSSIDGHPPDTTNEPSISWREYIQWFPEPAAEPTSTLVLTSAKRYFVDIRVLKPKTANEPALPNEGGPLSRLDWAFAGTSNSTLVPPPEHMHVPHPPGDPPASIAHCRWTHWVDSRAPPFEDEKTSDEGHLFPDLAGQFTLERGFMVNPATGQRGEYEEAWRDDDGESTATVLRMEDDGAKGMVVRVGGWCQGVVKVVTKGEGGGWTTDFSCERWKRGENGRWERVLKLGGHFLPCAVTWDEDIEVGGEVKYRGWEWQVVEATHRE